MASDTAQRQSKAAPEKDEERQGFLLRLADAQQAAPDAEAVTERTLRMLSDELGLDRCAVGIYLVSEDEAAFPYQVDDDRFSPLPTSIRFSDAPGALTHAPGRTVAIDDVSAMDDAIGGRKFADLGLRALVVAPMRQGPERPFWSIVAGCARPRRWTAAQIALIEEVARRTWAAIERVKAEARFAEKLEGMRRLHALHERLASETDLDRALQDILTVACQHLGTDRGCIQFVAEGEERLEMVAHRGYAANSPFVTHFRHEGAKAACDMARSHRKRLVIEDVATFGPLEGTKDREVALSDDIRATQSTPMYDRQGVLLGVLSNQFRQPHRPTDQQLEVIDLLAWSASGFVERHRAAAALRQVEASRRIALESGMMGAWHWNTRDWIAHSDETLQALWGVEYTDHPHSVSVYTDRMSPEDAAWMEAAMGREILPGEPFEIQMQVDSGAKAGRWIQIRGRADQDRPWIINGVSYDITERIQDEEHRTMLMAELDHRVKNILAVVQAMARRSLGDGEPVDAFAARISTLAQSHALLAKGGWEGASLHEVFDSSVGPHRAGSPERVVTDGPELIVTPKAAQSLNLAFHELATNAVKYGALSNEAGRVSVYWQITEERLVLTWQEKDGPPIKETPSRKGFGSLMIEQVLATEFGGTVDIDYARAGLRFVLDVPLNGLQAAGHRAPVSQNERRSTAGDPTQLADKKVLVVEDEYLIGQETARVLREAGCDVTGPIASLPEALRLAVSEDFDAGVLDINLNGTMVWPAARALHSRGIPLLFTTGYSETVNPTEALSECPRVEKPITRTLLVSELAAVMGAD